MQPLYEYVCHMKGHRNSKGELAEWVIKSHETGKILSSHKSEEKAKEHLQHMHIFGESVEGEAACSHCGWSADGVEEYNGRLLCPSCLTQFKWLDEHRDPENGTYEKYDLVPRESEKSDKLLSESTYGNNMDKRVKIFMEGVSQLGLSKNQVDAIGKITNVCMEGVSGNGELTRDEEAYEYILQCLHDMDIPDETIEIATHILGDSKETLLKIGNAVATLINNGDMVLPHEPYFYTDRDTGKVKFAMEGVGRRPAFYMEDRATATNPDLDYRSRYIALVEHGFSRKTLSILTTILGATVDTLNKIGQAKHDIDERNNMTIPSDFEDWDNGHSDAEIGSMDLGNDGDLGEIGKIGKDPDKQPEF